MHKESGKIEAWFKRNEPEFLQLLTTHFSELRFFLVSAMGHDESVRETLHPRRVLEPLLWLISTRWSLAWPVSTKIATRVAEVAIVAVLVLLFMGVPYSINAATSTWVTDVGHRLDDQDRHRRFVRLVRAESGQTALRPQPITSEPPVARLFAVVTAQAANARSRPSMQGDVVQVVQQNVRLPVTGNQGGWYRVQLPPPNQQREAWMYRSVLRVERKTL